MRSSSSSASCTDCLGHKGGADAHPASRNQQIQIEKMRGGQLRISIPSCGPQCRLLVAPEDIGLQSDRNGLFLPTDATIRSITDARAYLLAWKLFARGVLSDREAWMRSVGL